MFFIRRLEGVRYPGLGIDNNGTVHSATKPGRMGMPEKSALLLHQCEFVGKTLPRLDRTLGDVRRTIIPA